MVFKSNVSNVSLPEEDVMCVPVVDSDNGPIRHILVVIIPADSDSWKCDCQDGATTKASEPSTVNTITDRTPSDFLAGSGLTLAPSPEPTATVTPTTPAQSAASNAAAGPGPAIAIRPRQRRGLPQPPVLVTRDSLEVLRSLSLAQAARAVGVSPTAFKVACRRLGIQRWEYQRGRGPSLGSDSDSSQEARGLRNGQLEGICHFYRDVAMGRTGPGGPWGTAPPAATAQELH